MRETATNREEDGLLGRVKNMLTWSGCEHQHTLVVTSVGIRRKVCDDCGHISFSIVPRNRTPSPTQQKTLLRKAAGL